MHQRPDEQEVCLMRMNRNDPTANAAIGAVDRELKRTRREAERLRARYTRIFCHIWTEVMDR